MARLATIGFELNTKTANVEITGNRGTSTCTIQTTIVRSGTYALKIDETGAGALSDIYYNYAAAAGGGPYFLRAYVYIGTLPNADNYIIGLNNSASDVGTTYEALIQLTTTGTLKLFYNNAGTYTQIGSASSALNTGQWYCIELQFDRSPAAGSQVVKARIDQAAEFASATNLTINAGVRTLVVGANIDNGTADSAGVLYFDDIAINDNTGSLQTSYPGAGQVICLRPSAAGDNNAFTVQIGGTAGSSNNFTRVNEVTPDDVTTYNGDALSGDIDDFNIDDTPAGIGSSDTINVVQVLVRYRAVVAAAEAAFKVRVKKASGGTVSSSAEITPNSTTWKTNANAAPLNSPLTLYQDPDSSNWTKATLDTAQIGYTISTTNTNAADISAIYLLVDSTPAVGGGGGAAVATGYMTTNTGFWGT